MRLLAVLLLAGACKKERPIAASPPEAAVIATSPDAAPPIPTVPVDAPVAAVPIDAIDRAPADDAALLAAATAFVRESSAKGTVPKLTLTIRSGDHAQLAAKLGNERAMVFMKWSNGAWRGIDIGSSVGCEDLETEGFPDDVRKGCD